MDDRVRQHFGEAGFSMDSTMPTILLGSGDRRI
jgi:hypothetical protein